MSGFRSFTGALMLLLALALPAPVLAQDNQQKALQARKMELEQEIRQINELLLNEKRQKGTLMERMEAIDRKVNTQKKLIRVTNQQANLINRQINANIRKISRLRKDLNLLKEDYARMVTESYQNKSRQNRLMFLLSSENFRQAAKRWEYMKQYTNFRKKQVTEINQKTTAIKQANDSLIEQRRNKELLIQENRREEEKLSKEIASQTQLLQTIKANESRYSREITAKRKEAAEVDAEIQRLIRLEIARANRERERSSRNTTKFELTPEAKQLASDFQANKGNLIWPVEKGIKSEGFGIYYDKVYPGIKHSNSGVTIETEKGGQARSIFDGEVMTIMQNKFGQMGVYIRHGNFISFYYNLARVYVSKGDKVSAKTVIGDIFTNPKDDSTRLKFYLFEDLNKLNPEEWIYQL